MHSVYILYICEMERTYAYRIDDSEWRETKTSDINLADIAERVAEHAHYRGEDFPLNVDIIVGYHWKRFEVVREAMPVFTAYESVKQR